MHTPIENDHLLVLRETIGVFLRIAKCGAVIVGLCGVDLALSAVTDEDTGLPRHLTVVDMPSATDGHVNFHRRERECVGGGGHTADGGLHDQTADRSVNRHAGGGHEVREGAVGRVRHALSV